MPQPELEPDIPAADAAAAIAAAAVTSVPGTLPTDSSTCEADVCPSRDASRDVSSSSKPNTAGQQIAIDCCSLKDLASLSHEQLLQLCQAQAIENKALKSGMQWLATSRDAYDISSKEEAARQATVITQMQAAYESLHATNSSQAATIGCIKKQASGLQQQLGSAQFDAGKWQASYAALKAQAESKYAALAQESEAVIDKWAAHSDELRQQADKAAAKYAARTHCAELTSQRLSRAAVRAQGVSDGQRAGAGRLQCAE
jgi:hypothetical protein